MSELEYGMDPSGKTRFFGIYRGKVVNVNDPLKKYRVKLQVPQVLGTEISDWALPCLPVTSNDPHLDHRPHTGSELAALLGNHTGTFTTSDGKTVSVTFSHSGSSSKLTHKQIVRKKPKPVYDEVVKGVQPEHSPHRKVPRVGQTIWVMFEAGDPEHPVWMGVLS